MNEEQVLELQIQATAKETLNVLNKLVSSLTGVEKGVTNISKSLDKMSTKQAVNGVNQLDNSIKKASNSMKLLNNLFTFKGAKQATRTALSWINEAMDKTEQMNLFNVVFKNIEKNGVQTFSSLGREAVKFQNKLNEAFGANQTETLYMQGIFQSMGTSTGIKDTYASIMSESMTKLSYDLASLYNKQSDKVAEALRAGVYAGQTKPLRGYAIDVTQTTMAPMLESLGITDRTVKELNYAEKEILRYLITLKQSKIGMGDFANTIDSPSNQLKIFKQQLVEAKVALSSLFIGGFSTILPYANAFLMVVKEVSKAIADMFGIQLKDYNSGIASQEDAYIDLEDSIDGAIGKVKELKRQTLGFDQINNINENKNNGNNSSIVGGIDQRLLDAIKGYDNGMEQVRMKATEIRDSIMEWLGFTKETNPLTDEISFKYGGIKETIKGIYNWWDKTKTTTKLIMGLGFAIGLSKVVTSANKLKKIIGGSGIATFTRNLFSPLKTLTSLIKDSGGLNSSLGNTIDMWSKNLTWADKFKVGLTGGTGLLISLRLVKDGIKSVNDEGLNLSNGLQTAFGTLGTVASGAYAGSIFGPWGAVIGGALGAVGSLITALDEYETASEKMIDNSKKILDVAKNDLQNYYDNKKALEDAMNAELAHESYNQTLLDELEKIVDANGKVKKGYEDRANFILNQLNNAYGTEYKLIDGIIQGYGNLKESIDKLIQAKKNKIILDANEKNYKDAIEKEAQSWKKYDDAIKEYNKNMDKSNDLLDKKAYLESNAGTQMYKNYKYTSDLTGQTYKGSYAYYAIVRDLETYNEQLGINQETIDATRDTYENYVKDITFYEELSTAILTENVEEQNRLVNEHLKEVETANGKEKLSLSETLKYYQETGDTRLKILKNNGTDVTEEMKNQAYSQRDTLIESLIEQSKTVEKMTPDIAKAWATLGEINKEKFLEKFTSLPTDVQQQIVDKMYEKGYNISEELQKGINKKSPTINLKVNTSGAEQSITTFASWINGVFGFGGGGGGGGRFNAKGGVFSNGSWKNIPQYANGGMPSHGSMFVAGEAGAEIVGHINGRTEVLNQSQIASAIYSAVVSAMSQFSGQASQIDVHVHTDEGTVVDRINQTTKQTGVCPVYIPSN